MLHTTENMQAGSPSKVLKLSSNVRMDSGRNALKQSPTNDRLSSSHLKANEFSQNRSMILDSRQKTTDNSSNIPLQQKEVNAYSSTSIDGHEELLMIDCNARRLPGTEGTVCSQNGKLLGSSYTLAESMVSLLDQSNFPRTHTGFSSLQLQMKYKMEIQQLLVKVQRLQIQSRSLKEQNEHLQRSLAFSTAQKGLNQVCNKDSEAAIRKLEAEKSKIESDLRIQTQNNTSISKTVNDLKSANAKLQNENKKLSIELENQRQKIINLTQEKKQLSIELEQIPKMKELIGPVQHLESDKADVIRKDIGYQIQLIELNGVMITNLQSHQHDLKIATEQQQCINKQVEAIVQQIAVKLKDVMEQKQRLEDELNDARAETEKIRKTMFVGYQNIIAKLKDQIIQLKEENINLSNKSESIIAMAKLEREIKLLETKNQDLMDRNKEMQHMIEKLQATSLRRIAVSEVPQPQISKYYDRSGKADLGSIVMNYETWNLDLNERIHQKEVIELELKRKVEELENELKQIRDQAQLSSRMKKCDQDNVKGKLESLKMQLKSETDSLNRKIEALEKNIQRKNKEIKEKDNFITQYLIQRVKDQSNVEQIVHEIDKFFVEAAV